MVWQCIALSFNNTGLPVNMKPLNVMSKGSAKGKGGVLHLELTLWESHDIEYSVQLVVMVGVTSLNVLLSAVENRLRGEQLGKDAADGPNICKQVSGLHPQSSLVNTGTGLSKKPH